MTRYTPPCILNRCIFQMNMKGTPKEAAEKLHQEIDEYDRKIEECQQEIRNSIQTSLDKLLRSAELPF